MKVNNKNKENVFFCIHSECRYVGLAFTNKDAIIKRMRMDHGKDFKNFLILKGAAAFRNALAKTCNISNAKLLIRNDAWWDKFIGEFSVSATPFIEG
jgi:hypothetical protein